jgi:hypothetical protein
MYVVILTHELMKAEAWADFCQLKGLDIDIASTANPEAEWTLTPAEFLQLGLSLAAHD